MKGFNGKPFLDLTQYVDVVSFDKLQSEIFKGLALSKELAQIGNLEISIKNLDLEEYNFKPLIQSYAEFKELSDTDPIKLSAGNLDNSQLATYLKYAMGGYDLYVTYQKNLFEDYFPGLLNWINNLEIFQTITDAYIMTVDSGGIPFEHHHPPIDDKDISKLSEFVHIRPNLDRPFYVRDSSTRKKHYIDTRVAYWNDQDSHGGDIIFKPSYSLRIDGMFTDSFKEKILKND